MQIVNEDAAHEIRQLTKAVKDKDQEITFLNAKLTRYKVYVVGVSLHGFSLTRETDSCTYVKTYYH